MPIKVKELSAYVKAVKASGLEERDASGYNNCLEAVLNRIEGDVLYFRNTITPDVDFWEYCFTRQEEGVVRFEYTTYKEYDEEEEE